MKERPHNLTLIEALKFEKDNKVNETKKQNTDLDMLFTGGAFEDDINAQIDEEVRQSRIDRENASESV